MKCAAALADLALNTSLIWKRLFPDKTSMGYVARTYRFPTVRVNGGDRALRCQSGLSYFMATLLPTSRKILINVLRAGVMVPCSRSTNPTGRVPECH